MEAAEASAIKVQESRDSRYPVRKPLHPGQPSWPSKGDFESAAQQYRSFLRIVPEGRSAVSIKQSLAAWEQQGLIRARDSAPAPSP